MKLEIDKSTYISFYKTEFYKNSIMRGYKWNELESSWCNIITIFAR